MGDENRRLRADTMPMEGRVSLSNFLEVLEGLQEMGYHPRTKSEVLAICVAEVAQFMVDKGIAIPCYEPDVAEVKLTDYGMLRRRHIGRKSKREARAEDTFQLRMAARSATLDDQPEIDINELETVTEKQYIAFRNIAGKKIQPGREPVVPQGRSGDLMSAGENERRKAIAEAFDQAEKNLAQVPSLSHERALEMARASGQVIPNKQSEELTPEEFADKEKTELDQIHAILGSIKKEDSDEAGD